MVAFPGMATLNLGTVPDRFKQRLIDYANSKNLTPTAAARLLITEGLDRAEKGTSTRPRD